MNTKQIEQWKIKGIMKFIFIRGVLSWGLPIGVIYSLWAH